MHVDLGLKGLITSCLHLTTPCYHLVCTYISVVKVNLAILSSALSSNECKTEPISNPVKEIVSG